MTLRSDAELFAEFERKHPGCCPRCGWHMSSHGDSGYGPDCPWGVSPANRAGDCIGTTNAMRYGLPVPYHLTHDEAEMWVEGYRAAKAEA